MKNKLVAFLFVETDSPDENSAPLLARIPDVDEVHRVAGEDSYLLKVRLRDTAALEQLREKIERIKFVRNTRTTIVLKTVKDHRTTVSARRSSRSEQYVGGR